MGVCDSNRLFNQNSNINSNNPNAQILYQKNSFPQNPINFDLRGQNPLNSSTNEKENPQLKQNQINPTNFEGQIQQNLPINGKKIPQDPENQIESTNLKRKNLEVEPDTKTLIASIQKNNEILNNLIQQNKMYILALINVQKNQTEKNNLTNQISNDKVVISKLNIENINLNNSMQQINFDKNLLESQKILVTQINHLQIIKSHYEEKKNSLSKKEEKIKEYEKENSLLKEKLEKMEEKTIVITNTLQNIGATCYMNATLQSLSNTQKLTNFFLNKYEYNPNDKSKRMSNEFSIVIKNLWDKKNQNKPYAPHSFKNALSQENPLFAGVQANDSKDLINFLLERLHKELNEPKSQQNNNYSITQADQLDENKVFNLFFNEFEIKYHSIISDLFYGIMETKSKCLGCNNIKYNFQIYSFLEFPLEQVNKYCFNKGVRNNNQSASKNPDVDLYECFNYYENVELMTGDNQMFCNICQRKCDAKYGTNLYSLPNYLIINLNRGKGAIYECKVNYPENLNLLNFVTLQKGKTYFELYSVISHIGPSSMSGHFVAYCKHHMDKKWYKYNDSIVTPCIKEGEYNEGMPYILFYKAV